MVSAKSLCRCYSKILLTWFTHNTVIRSKHFQSRALYTIFFSRNGRFFSANLILKRLKMLNTWTSHDMIWSHRHWTVQHKSVLYFRTCNVVNWILFRWNIGIYATIRFKCLAFTGLNVSALVQVEYTLFLHLFYFSHSMLVHGHNHCILVNAAFKSIERWIKCDMRNTKSSSDPTTIIKTKPRKHTIFDASENCIKKQCNRLPISIDIYLCLISFRNIEIV